MKVNIERAIKSIKEKIDFYQPLYEAIVNSFQADADELYINFIYEEKEGNKYVVGYSIKDNGVGFTNKNIDGFLTLWSDNKIEKGALGSGRILCLKVFDNIIIESQTKGNENTGQKVNIDFNREFKANTVKEVAPIKNASSISYTLTTFKNINNDFIKEYEKNKKPFNPKEIQDDIFINLLPLFINKKTSDKPFSIYFANELWLDKNSLINKFTDLNFEHKYFDLIAQYDDEDHPDEKFTFTLTYQVKKDSKGQLEQFYGASDRKVRDFTSSIKIKPLPEKASGIFCLTSSYLDKRVKDSRKDFTISVTEQNTTDEHPISFPSINDELEKLLIEILFEKFPNIEEKLNNTKKSAASKFPHLARYIKPIKKFGASESDILKDAEKEFNAETKKVREEIDKFTKAIKKDKKKFNEKAYEEITRHFTQVGREQLADYIGYRQTIIDMLIEIYADSMNEEKYTPKEEDIHNLFMPQYKNSNTSFLYANNMWIFDDKFMSYNYSASDHTIEQIMVDVTGKPKEEIEDYQGGKKPDLVMFYSSNPEKPENEQYDVLLVEFKRLNYGIDSKEKALAQLKKYPYFIKENIKSVRSIHTYTIMDIDKEFETTLVKFEKFKEHAFGDKDNKISAYYRYDEESNAHTNIVSFSQVIQDANKRNKVFLDILIQNFNYEE